MGDRYTLKVKCECGFVDDDVWYAPTSNAMTWKCPKCNRIIDLERYSGIDAEGTANTEEGIKAIRRQRREMKKLGIK